MITSRLESSIITKALYQLGYHRKLWYMKAGYDQSEVRSFFTCGQPGGGHELGVLVLLVAAVMSGDTDPYCSSRLKELERFDTHVKNASEQAHTCTSNNCKQSRA